MKTDLNLAHLKPQKNFHWDT